MHKAHLPRAPSQIETMGHDRGRFVHNAKCIIMQMRRRPSWYFPLCRLVFLQITAAASLSAGYVIVRIEDVGPLLFVACGQAVGLASRRL